MSNAKRYNPQLEKISGKVRGIGLYLLPMPLALMTVIALWKGDLSGVLMGAIEFSLFTLAAIIARHGFRLEQEYTRRKIARAPRPPWKSLAAATLGIATGATAWLSSGYGAGISALFGLGAFVSFHLLYGLDPRRDKSGNISLGVTAKEVIELLEKAGGKLTELERAGNRIHELDYARSIRRIVTNTRAIIDGIEADPSDLARSRKFLNTYLAGILRVTNSYLRVQDGEPGSDLKQGFGSLLNDFERTVQDHQAELLENDRFNLDVQIKVLETQLNKEGIY